MTGSTPGADSDRIWGEDGDDVVYAGGGSDRIKGNNGVDIMYGQNNNDAIYGGAGTDYLDGGNGNDWLLGGWDADELVGGAGNDKMWGGQGADVFVFEAGTGFDIIKDFEDGIDTIGIVGFATSDSEFLKEEIWGGVKLEHDTTGEIIFIENVALADIGSSDFAFI